jgi:hypothetical protein
MNPCFTVSIACALLISCWVVSARAERTLSSFEDLTKRSPFSLPTAEEKSPLGDRYVVTGAASWDGTQRVFVMDKNSQERHTITAGSGPQAMELIEFMPSADPREMKARVRIGQEVATLSFEAAAPANPAQAAALQNRGQPQQPGNLIPNANPGVNAANSQQTSPPVRRIIRRRPISATPAPNQP